MAPSHSTLTLIFWVLVLAVAVPASCLALGIALLRSIQWSSASQRNSVLTLAGLAAASLLGFAAAAAFSPFSWDAVLYLALGVVWSGAAFGHWHTQRHLSTGTGNDVAP